MRTMCCVVDPIRARSSAFRPWTHPHEIVRLELERAVNRTQLPPVRFRPWLQAFRDYAFDRRSFAAGELRLQISAAEAAGTNGWMVWNPRNRTMFPIRSGSAPGPVRESPDSTP
jgi:hypothetical protein